MKSDSIKVTAAALDEADRRLLTLLQQDASLTNQALAERAHLSPPTCLRRVRRLVESGVIERQVAILAPELTSAGLTAIVEVTLDRQAAESMVAFEERMGSEAAVQQCYRVSPGPDFVLVLHIADMATYHALAHRVFTATANVRNVRAFFSIHRSKFAPRIEL